MDLLIGISDHLDRWITRVGRVAAWAGVALIALTVFDVVTRRSFVLSSTKLQELEWHFHVVLFAFCLGFAYLKDAHVRIDLVRENLSKRIQWWIELLGCMLFLLPYCALVVYFSFDFTVRSFNVDEVSASATGKLIPPSIMLVIMADLLARSVGNLFVAAVFPGLILAGFYVLFIVVVCGVRPRLAPPLPALWLPRTLLNQTGRCAPEIGDGAEIGVRLDLTSTLVRVPKY